MKYLLVIVLVFVQTITFAQSNNVEQLEQELSATNSDTTKLRLYVALSAEINQSRDNKYGEKAIKLANQLADKGGDCIKIRMNFLKH